MTYIPRNAESRLKYFARGYPVVAVTGPRESGKSTLVRHAFPKHPYVSLENLDQTEFAETDSRDFLNQFTEGAILDEAQRCPALFSYLQTRVDERQQPGEFILPGSQQFGLLSGITQSLAGRAALLTLLPMAYDELQRAERVGRNLDKILFDGAYPPIFDRELEPHPRHGNYVRTYLEHDVRQLINVQDLATFQRGALFESWVISELLKARYNAGETSNLYFWRDRSGNEVDLLIDHGTQLSPPEIKSGQTINQDYFKGLEFWQKLAGDTAEKAWLVYGGDSRQIRSDVTVLPWHEINSEQVVI